MDNFTEKIGYRTLFPLALFVLGTYTLFLFVAGNEERGIFFMIFSFVIYIANNIVENIYGYSNLFNDYLEDMAVFYNFGISTIIFGLIFYSDSFIVLTAVIFYSLTVILGLARNWVLGFKNTKGWPLGLNGLFFPLFFYIYKFYLQGPGDSIFIFFYVVVGFLSISNYNFLSSESKFLDEFMNPKGVEELKIKKRVNNRIVEQKIKIEEKPEKIDLENDESNDEFVEERLIENEKLNFEVKEDFNQEQVSNLDKENKKENKLKKKANNSKFSLVSFFKNFYYKTFTSNKSKVALLFKDDNYNSKVTKHEAKEVFLFNQINEENQIKKIDGKLDGLESEDIEFENSFYKQENITDNNLNQNEVFEEKNEQNLNQEVYVDDFDKDPSEIYLDEGFDFDENDKIEFVEDNNLSNSVFSDYKVDRKDSSLPKLSLKSKLKNFIGRLFTPNKSKVASLFKDDDYNQKVTKKEIKEV